jgi:hypothetical protein
VNPTASPLVANFNGSYTGSGLTNATAATMGPHTGLILQGGTLAPAPAPTPMEPAPTEPTPTDPAPAPTPTKERKRRKFAVAVRTTRGGAVRLRWNRRPARTRNFRVLRNGRSVAVTKRLRVLDGTRRRGKHRYRVVAIGPRGGVLGRSRVVTVRH